jgi:hypothetical protein
MFNGHLYNTPGNRANLGKNPSPIQAKQDKLNCRAMCVKHSECIDSVHFQHFLCIV